MKNLLYSCFLSSILVICVTACTPAREDDRLINQIISKHAAIQKKRGLSLCATGGCNKEGKTQGPSIDYVCKEPMNIPQARKLFVELSEEMIALMNSCEAIQPYMYHSPFIFKDLKMGILFFQAPSTYRDYPYVGLVSTLPDHQKVYYSFHKYDPSIGQDGFVRKYDHEETYEEALRLTGRMSSDDVKPLDELE